MPAGFGTDVGGDARGFPRHVDRPATAQARGVGRHADAAPELSRQRGADRCRATAALKRGVEQPGLRRLRFVGQRGPGRAAECDRARLERRRVDPEQRERELVERAVERIPVDRVELAPERREQVSIRGAWRGCNVCESG
jgi:hypothetical protein